MSKIMCFMMLAVILNRAAYAGRDHFLLIGSPGAGKGTLTQFLNTYESYAHLCLGDMLRAEIDKDSEIGKTIKSQIERGQLVPNEIIFILFEESFANAIKDNKKIIVDGMVQSEAHIKFFDNLLSKYNLENNFNFVYLSIPKDIAKKRLLSRLVCNNCNNVTNLNLIKEAKCPKCGKTISKRIDDQLKTVDKRLDRFFNQVIPLVKHYADRPGFKEHDSSKEYDLRIVEYKENYLQNNL